MTIIAGIYDKLGLTMSAEAERRIALRIKANPEGQVEHRYNLADFGLKREAILERYRWYIDTYNPQL